MSDVERITASIDKLNGRNYHLLRYQIEMVCRARDLWEVVEYSDEDKSTVTSTDWKKKESKALALMVLSTVPHIQAGLRKINTPKEVLAKFDKEYRNKGLANHIRLRRKFVTMTLPAGMKMEEHLSKMTALADELTAIGAEVPDEELSLAMLGSLPESYATLITALDANETIPSPDFVRVKILEEEERQRNLTSVANNADAALATHGHGGSGSNKKKSECRYCKKLGHWEKDCRKKKRDEKAPASVAIDSLLVTVQPGTAPPPHTFICDSCATQHVVTDSNMFASYKPMVDTYIEVANGTKLRVHGEGIVNLQTTEGHRVSLTDAWHVPDSKFNLFSVRKAVSFGNNAAFHAHGCVITNSAGEVVLRGTAKGRQYVFTLAKPTHGTNEGVALVARELTEAEKETMLWHERMGHMGISTMRKIAQQQLVKGMPVNLADLPFCEGCAEGKHKRSPFPSRADATALTRPLQLVHTDVMGPIHPPSIGGARWVMVVVDDWTRLTWCFALASKTEVTNALKQFINTAKASEPHKPIAFLCTDNGTEYVSNAMQQLLAEHGITHQTTAPYTPESNGLAERTNRTLTEMARSMLHGRKLDQRLWAEAVHTATYLKNQSPSSALPGSITPFERFSGVPPEVLTIRAFGSPAWVHQPKEKRDGKWAARSAKHIFLGYEHHGAYRLLDVERNFVVRSHDVLFDEQQLGASNRPQPTVQVDGQMVPVQHSPGAMPTPQPVAARPARGAAAPVPTVAVEVAGPDVEREVVVGGVEGTVEASGGAEGGQAEVQGQRELDNGGNGNAPEEAAQAPAPAQRLARVQRVGERRSARLAEGQGNTALVVVGPEEPDTPRTVEEALGGPDADKWKAAMQKEIDGLVSMGTWTVVEKPKGANVVSCKWVFKIKKNADGTISSYKARLVARGFTQVKGVDYEEVFAHTARIGSFRLVIVFACVFDMELHQMDYIAAYLNGTNKFKLYMQPPKILGLKASQVLLMLKTLYGFKHSAHEWGDEYREFLKSIGFVQLSADASVFLRKRNGVVVIVVVYVDDVLIAAMKGADMPAIKKELSSKFKATDLGEAHHILGIRIIRDRAAGTITLDQQRYAEEVLQRFGMENAKGVLTPMEAKAHLVKATENSDPDSAKHYRAIVGSLQYLAQGTRPDLSYTMSVLGQFGANPDDTHQQAAKRVLRYLRRTAAAKLVFKSTGTVDLEAYCDASFAADYDDRMSVTGFITNIAGGAVYWNSRKQPTVALSTTEAEYMAAGAAGRQAVHLMAMFKELGHEIKSVSIQCDSQSAMAVTKNPVQHGRTKHIDVIHHWVKDKVAAGELTFEYVDTEHQVADALTKPLAFAKHLQHAKAMGLQLD